MFWMSNKEKSFSIRSLIWRPALTVWEVSNKVVGIFFILSHDVVLALIILSCNKIDKPLVVYRFSGNAMIAITMLCT